MTVYTIDKTPVAHWDDSENYVSYEDWKKYQLEESGYQYFKKGDIYDPERDARMHINMKNYEEDRQMETEDCWELFLDDLQEAMGQVNPYERYWHVSGKGVGWLRRSGEKVVREQTAREWLWEILPHTEYTLTVYTCTTDDNQQALRLVCSHHDAMGEEYYCVPMTEEENEVYG